MKNNKIWFIFALAWICDRGFDILCQSIYDGEGAASATIIWLSLKFTSPNEA